MKANTILDRSILTSIKNGKKVMKLLRFPYLVVRVDGVSFDPDSTDCVTIVGDEFSTSNLIQLSAVLVDGKIVFRETERRTAPDGYSFRLSVV